MCVQSTGHCSIAWVSLDEVQGGVACMLFQILDCFPMAVTITYL